jgi:hypothetical protein
MMPDRNKPALFVGYLEFLERFRHEVVMTTLKKWQEYLLKKDDK